ncbi:uncharacterized protein LOC130807403 isoform X2 [Amaranthus tricolor]|uniref:uncharacterized protein LOC130807403 isoform X2 n=1 Tax=Amaranthus tricolor TaxID=29722 RepID=UPI002582F7F3|nr:uncharacterized protein LOC130807403 isoform X2 [Amaranthus tricolor]XP_057528579.1 uncharacterized protein LOC130807403 isoform X2 [Amaranthus tricolor]XP_057528580.1 uncharacterized protein LOC130807403 isoform X2 [Amaranthus tricolor]
MCSHSASIIIRLILFEVETDVPRMEASGFHSVPFSYGENANSSDQKNPDVATDLSAFHPSFSVPESLVQNMPPTEKVHQIIARTALFVSEHGGQSEIVLRVKQGDNPTFGFLMPHHHLHPYFRYLVDHPEILKADHGGKSQGEKTSEDRTGGALSLLGSVYGTEEDEDASAVNDIETKQDSDKISTEAVISRSQKSGKIAGPGNMSGNDEMVSKVAHFSKPKLCTLGKNHVSSIKSASTSAFKKDANIVDSSGSIMDKSMSSSLFPLSKAETLLVDPPSEIKRLIDRIVELILKNGKDFEAVLLEQDKKHGKFLFLLPSNQYHAYYQMVLKKAQESRLIGKSFGTAPRNESSALYLGSGNNDLFLDNDKKEKFIMIIGKSKKDTQDQPSKETRQQSGITVDTAAAAAILQAATRGIKKPNLDIFSQTSLSGASPGSSNDGGQASSLGSLQSSQHQSFSEKEMESRKPCITIPVAKEIAKTAARAADGEADSSEAGLTREQKLKAERLRRAKMFAAMIKSGAAPLGTEPKHASSTEPTNFSLPCWPTDVAEVKDREGSSAPAEAGTFTRKDISVRNFSDDEKEVKARKRRHYRSRNHDGSGEDDEYEKIEEDKEDDLRRSRKKSCHSSRRHRGRKNVHRDRRKHSSSSTKDSRNRHREESSSSLEDDRHNRYRHDSSSADEHKHLKRKHKHCSSSEDERKHHKRKHKHCSSSEDEHKHRKRKHKHSKKDKDLLKGRSRKGERSQREEVELEEGEIRTKSTDHSSSAVGDDTCTEASVEASKSSYQENTSSLLPLETTEVPDELRAKIRAMLLASL